MNIVAESGFVSELEDMFKELLLFLKQICTSPMGSRPSSDIYEYICIVFD